MNRINEPNNNTRSAQTKSARATDTDRANQKMSLKDEKSARAVKTARSNDSRSSRPSDCNR